MRKIANLEIFFAVVEENYLIYKTCFNFKLIIKMCFAVQKPDSGGSFPIEIEN